MATSAMLRSQDCLLRPNRFHSEGLPSPPFKPRRNPNLNPSPQPTRFRHRKRSPVGSPDRAVVARLPAKNPVMGQVKILKRGEELKPPQPLPAKKGYSHGGDEDFVLYSTDRLGPEPETVQKQIRVSVVDGRYAGSAAFFASPPPSSLPLPGFFSTKEKNDAATSDLRRLLRLDLV